MEGFWNTLSALPIVLQVGCLFAGIVTQRPALPFIAVASWGVSFVSETLKQTIFRSNGRPEGAKNCNLASNDGLVGGRPGMPSSHSAVITFLSLTLVEHMSLPLETSSLLILPVIASRLAKRCHSVEQVVAGFLLGGLSFLFFRHMVPARLR